MGPDFVLAVLCAGKAIYWLHWLESSLFLWNGLFSHRSHMVDKQFLAFFWHSVVIILFLLCGIEFLAPLFLFPGFFWVFSTCSFCLFSAGDTDFCNVPLFYSSGTLVGVRRRSFLWHVGSQCLFVTRQELPNCSARIPFLGVLQSVHTCYFRNIPNLLLSSGVVVLWRLWIVRWWRGQLLRKRLWPVFEVCQENQLFFGLLVRK